MTQSRRPTTLSLPSDKGMAPRSGYVRSKVTHIGTEWRFEVLSDDRKVAVATIQTLDGPLHIGLNRAEATKLAQMLQLFLHEWSTDHPKS